MSAQHTPGPWVADQFPFTGPAEDRSAAIMADTLAVAMVAGYAHHHDEARANAHLIAAAPDMLEALRAVDRLWTNDAKLIFPEEAAFDSPLAKVWAPVRAAIAKATGAQS